MLIVDAQLIRAASAGSAASEEAKEQGGAVAKAPRTHAELLTWLSGQVPTPQQEQEQAQQVLLDLVSVIYLQQPSAINVKIMA